MKKFSKKLKLILIILFIICFVIDLYNLIFQENFIILLENKNLDELILYLSIIIIIDLFINILRFFFIIVVYFAIKLAVKRVYKEKLSEIDFKNNQEYFI